LIRGVALLAVALGLLPTSILAQELSTAEKLYHKTDYHASLVLLNKQSESPAVNFLIGRNYFMLEDFRKAADYFQKAVSENPQNSQYVDWLGRAYGRRASNSNPFTAPTLAGKARDAFERAVQLDPSNTDALSDLFDYYLDAPGFLGGGYEKAAEVARRISALDPAEGDYDKAKLAQKRKEYQSAEEHLRRAIAASPNAIGHVIALAQLLAQEGKIKESDASFQRAQQINPNSPRVWFAEADALIKQRRNLDEARNLLEKYVQAPVTADDPPKQQAFKLLKEAGGA
jgi:tetratricopeptide (TPR) repeat protein